MPLPFNKNLDLKLLKLVKENSILYNTKHSKYLDFDSREVVWQKIGDSLSRPAAEFAGIQCQIHLGDYQEKKHKPGFIENLEEYLPAQYSNAWNIEKKILKEYSNHQGKSELEAKFLYIKTARALPTYGVTFFLVKEKQKDKKKLVPRLLGINAEAILRLDEVTKEILQQWPLTHVKTYHAGKSQTFTLNFGDYSDKEYSVKTQDCHRIRDILEGYIDIIRRRMLAKPCADPGESMAIYHDNVQMGSSNLIEMVSNNSSRAVTEYCVGPNKLMPHEQGSHAHSGTTITTVQQIVVTDHLQNQQQALKGEMPLRGDMSENCIRKLNRMNSNSVKIVGLLTDPTETHVEDAQKIVHTMQEDLPVVEKGVKETADKQAIEDSKKKLLDELEDLNNFMNKLASSTEQGHVNPTDAKEAAECIADLTTQMYFSIDPVTRRRSDLLRRSRKSFKAGEKTEQTLRRASFVAAATTALHAVDTAAHALQQNYTGPKLDDDQGKQLEKALEDKMGKLNAAIALYLTAHSDPENIDYSKAINSMNAINELMPELAKDAQMLASTKDPAARKELLDEMKALFDATKKVCGMTSTRDHEKMQEASNNYAKIADKLIFTFARGTNKDKEDEIIELAKAASEATSALLVAANELTCQAGAEPAAADVGAAGRRASAAARDLLACARLTAPAIHEPHCQSALTAAGAQLAGAAHQLESCWRPLLEHPTRQPMAGLLHKRAVDVGKALERLKDAYGNLEGEDDADNSLPRAERQRLKFISTMSGAKNKLQGVEDMWDQQSATGAPSEQEKAAAQRRLEQRMGQLNAAVAALAAATADRENPDYATAELAISTISDLMPEIVKDAELVSSDKDEATRTAMQRNIRALCDATRQMCEGAGYQHGQGEAASNFAAASGKLVFLISPDADKGKQKYVMELSSVAHSQAAQLAARAHVLQAHVLAPAAADLASHAAQNTDAAQALLAVAQVTSSSIGEARCQDALRSAVEGLHAAAGALTSACHHHSRQRPELQHQCASIDNMHQQLNDTLSKIADACQAEGDNSGEQSPAQREKQRLQFINSLPAAKRRLDAAALQLTKPMVCQMMAEEYAAVLEGQLSQQLAKLNAAVAALTAATADRENPDYKAADRAVSTIIENIPQVIQDSRKLCGTKTDAEQAAMLQELRALCEASQQICEDAGQPQGLGEAAAKFSAASSKLVFCITPGADNAKENEVVGLTAESCAKASELLSQVQRLTELVPDAGAAADLDHRGARAADAAQALLTVAQATASTIGDPHCQKELISAAEKLRGCTAELTSACGPHLQQRPEMQQQVLSTQHQLADTLDKLVHACRAAPVQGTQSTESPAEREKRRLKFINSVSGAKNRLYDAEQQLKQPISKQTMKQEDTKALEEKLSQRLAQLNAAVAALTAAKADDKNPDYAAAEQAVKDISELMPQIVQDTRKLSGTKDDAGRAAMMEQLRALCEASRTICEDSEHGPGISSADFKKASTKMVYLVSPATGKAKEEQVLLLTEAACSAATAHLSAAEQLRAGAAAQLSPAGARAREAAGVLSTTAGHASQNMSEPGSYARIVVAAETLRSAATDLTSSCNPHLQQKPEMQQQVLSTQHQLDDSIDKLVHACQAGHNGNLVKFLSSVGGASSRLDAVEQQLKEPMICQMMKQEDGAVIERNLSQRLAQLNAAVAALAAATADRENPDYATADQAVRTITELMPQVVQDSRTICGTKPDASQAAMLQELRALCEASQQLCASVEKQEGLSDAAAKFSAASAKLLYVVSPKGHDAEEKQVLALSAVACGKSSELLSQVQRLTELVPDAGAAADLDHRGARAADAAQTLLTVAQATTPTIGDPHCQKELISSAEKLRSCTAELTSACGPHLQQRPEMQQQVSSTQHQLADTLDKLVHACRAAQHGQEATPSAQQEKHRLKFISSVSGAKTHLDAAEQQLKEPLVSQVKQGDAATLQRNLSQRLAQLNAAVAALAAATADREHPDYAAAHRAVETIPKLLREVIHDSRMLTATKDCPGQAAMTEDLRALCEASREICENAGQPQGLSEAAAKFSAASGKMITAVGPKTHSAHEKQVIDLSAMSCGKASELLSQVQRLTELVPDAGAAADLDTRGARAADAAQALLTVVQATAPTIGDPHCQKELISAAEKLRSCTAELTSACGPHLQQRPEMQQQVSSTQHQLADTLDKLVHACRAAQHGQEDAPSAQQEKHRLKFISSVSGAKTHLDAAEQQLKEPLVSQVKQGDAATLQRNLSQRLAQLNAAVAALAAATADREHPDYASAHRAVETIPKLLREVIHDSRMLSATKDCPGQAAMTEDLRALCEASREICENAGQPQGLGEAAAKFSAASGKMMTAVGPKSHSAHEKQVIDLSAMSCGKASELLSQVQRLTELVPDAGAAADLDHRGARAADAAQGLLNIAQVTSLSVSEPECSAQLIGAAENLRSCTAELTSACGPHLQQRPEMQQQVSSTQHQLADTLDKLVHACRAAQHGTDVVLSPQQEKQRVQFVNSVSGAKKRLDAAEQQIKKPVVCQTLKQADEATLQHQLSRRLGQLNAAVAALAAATCDGKNPDYPAAERAVTTIIELMPKVVQESHILCGTKEGAQQAAALQHVRELCDASRAICDSEGQPTKLHEASAKLANASGKLVFIVSPEARQQAGDASSQDPKPAVPTRKPAVPVRDPKHTIAHAVHSSRHSNSSQEFLDTLRGEESDVNKAKIVGIDTKGSHATSEDEKREYTQFAEMIDNAEKGLQMAQDELKGLCNAKSVTVSGTALPAVEVARREQHMEDTLATAGVQVASLVAANYADKMDYKAAMEPTISLTKSVRSVVDDGRAIHDSLPEHARKPFLDDLTGLCQATKSICDAAKSKKEELNAAAISFGDQSAKLLRVVSCNVNPTLEKEMISKAKAIGDTASRLALEASNVASEASTAGTAPSAPPAAGDSVVRDICTAGTRCVDAAGKLVYTAKLIAPTIHHSTCQDTLVSSADNLSSSLATFSKTWAPLASAQQPNVHKLTEEAAHLEELVEKLRKDVRAGKLGKTRVEGYLVNLDTPLKRMTMQIIDTAKNMVEHGEMQPELKKEYTNYSNRLEEAVRALDLATARYQRAPYDKNKRDEMEIAKQDLQMTLLQTRPSKVGQEQNYIVDFRDFLQDLVKEANQLQETAKKNEGPAGKRTTDDIKLLCSKISEDAARLLNPPDNYKNFGDGVTVMRSADDIMDIDMFGQECDVLVKEINSAIQGIQDQKTKNTLRAKALPLTESCHLLRFATNSHIMATKTAAYDEALQNLDHFKATLMEPLAKEAAKKTMKEKKSYASPLGACCQRRAGSALLRAHQRAVRGQPEQLCRALTHYAAAAQPAQPDTQPPDLLLGINDLVNQTNIITMACDDLVLSEGFHYINNHARNILKELNDLDYKISARNIKTPVLNPEDIDKLLLCQKQPVEGTPKQLEDKLQQLSTKLSSMSGTVVLSVKKPDSLARSLHAAADVAAQLASVARALKDNKKPVQSKIIEDATHEMCLATYNLLKTSELVCQDPNHHDSRRKLLEVCRHLNDSINKLVRSVSPVGRVRQECSEVQRSLQLQRSVLQAAPQPSGALPYVHCVDTLQSQRDLLQKLNSDQAMSREEFLKSMTYVASAVSNSTECAAQAAYLLSVSEKDESIGKEGIVDVAKLHKAIEAVEDTCISIIIANHEEQVQEENKVLIGHVKDLLDDLDGSIKKTKNVNLRDMLKECRESIFQSSTALCKCVEQNVNDKEAIISMVMNLMDDINYAGNLIEHTDLVPTAGEVSADTQKQIDEVVKSSLTLLTNTEELMKQVKTSPEEEVMKWVMFNKRKDVLDAFENLLKNIKSTGQRVKLLEGSTDDSEEEKKSYVQKQFDAASKWLLKPVSKADVKTNGQQAVRNLIEVANKVTEDLKGSEKEDMKHLMMETEQLLSECTTKYDHEQYSVLMERVRELKKGIERGVVTRVVEDFMEAEAPLADLDLLADYERDESKRKFLLEKKIAELLAQLSRVTKTARLIADTDRDAANTVSTQLNSCSQQAELLAPMLVKAAQQRVASPDDKAVIENYKSLLARYAESLSKIRDLCDQSVDPMDFVQTAGETMERMREESTKHNDPMKCAHTSAAITKLANRVIHVGMSSSTVRSDPELQKALTEAQQQLTAATPAADTRASRMPDWKDTTAKILQATEEVEALLCGETIFKNQPGPNQPIYNEALNLHVAIRDWSSRDNEIVAVAKRMAVLMAKLSNFMNNDKQREVLATSKSIVSESHEVARLAKKLAHECTDHRIKTNLLQACERIPTISGQLKMLTTVKGFSLGRHGTQEDKEAMDMLVGNAQSLMLSIQDVVKGAASASVKIMSQRGLRMKWVRKTVY